ncbi:MAG: PilZ domain-containing protein [Verrucomicrobiales bacterium]|nr:PilZ domain-containing protein [Verrucomicrobiales bacterium]
MSAGRADRISPTPSLRAEPSDDSALSLPASAVTIRKNGIEFVSKQPLAQWTEVTLSIESSVERKRVNCRGVVVACDGNRHKGYQVSLLFLGLTPQIQERLESLALSHLR